MQETSVRKSHKLLVVIALVLAGPLFLMMTNPDTLPLAFVVIPFVWLFAVLYLSINFVIRRLWPDASKKRRIIVVGIGSALPVLLLVFESIHQLTAKDLLLALALVACVSFYMARADFIQ